MALARLFEFERRDNTLILNLRQGAESLEFGEETPDVFALTDFLRAHPIRNIVVDCHDIDFLRSTALGFFVILWQRIKDREGKMAFCNTSEKGREVLVATKLARIWTICDTRADAFTAVADE